MSQSETPDGCRRPCAPSYGAPQAAGETEGTPCAFYRTGFGQTEEAFALIRKHPGKLTYNHCFDPRFEEAGLRQPREGAARFGLKGVKLYTAEWKGDSRGYQLDDP
ncbi:amidohydrolase family protein [Streptomyces tendae]|uniref:amidohydrolase family protein n=1 Tax=Streptomyces tendae TaxID=1932 RepID=UPI00371CB205